MHAGFASKHPGWVERVEVGYLSRRVLQTLAGTPEGTIAVISPGEPLNRKEIEWDWVLNWRGACTRGEVIRGPQPLELGPGDLNRGVSTRRARAAPGVAGACPTSRSSPTSRSRQGYTVVTVCRALHALETGEQATKEAAAERAAARYPEWAAFIGEALAAHRADLAGPHARTIAFVDFATGESR